MSIGIDFILRASSAGFTKAMAGVNNSLKDVKKSIREFDVGGGLKQALGVGGVIAGFRAAITHAQDLRKALEESGKAVPENIASVARYGDAIKDAADGAKMLAVNSLSFFTKAGEAWGNLINQVRGYSKEQVDSMAATEKAAKQQEEQAAKAKQRMADAGKQADKDFASQSRKNKMDAMTPEQRQEALALELRDVNKRMSGMNEGTDAWKVERAKAETLSGEINAIERDLQADVSKKMREEDKKMADEKKKKEDEVREKFAPSVEQLAAMEVGGFAEVDDPRLKARQILEKERRAGILGSRGDIKGALALGSEAQAMREGLAKTTGNGTALTAETAETALKNALEQTNKELVEVKGALAGIIKAQR